ncbi:O-antigen ligase family protein [Candidatus Collierbacteria bacterium]|nr:O-antigen ligase family protein [Candidatus Collierbacteria bacterium]
MFIRLDRTLQLTIRALFITLFFFLPLIFWIPSSEVFEFPKMLFVYLMTTLIIAVWTIRMILAGRIILRWTPLDIPILLFLLSQVVSTIYSIDHHISWFGWYGRFNGGLVSTISYTVLYYAFVANISENSENSESRKVRKSDNQKTGASGSLNLRFSDFSGFRSIPSVPIFAILSSATIVSLYAIFQHFGIDRDFWIQDVATRVFSTQGQPNWLAGFLVMIIPLTWMLMTKSKEQKAKNGNKNMIVFCFLFFVFFTALLFTKSRSGLLGFAVMDVVFWLTVFAINNKQKAKSKNLKSFVFIHSIILILVFITNNPARDWFFKTIQLVKNQSEQSVISNQQLAINLRKSELGGTESGDIRRIVWNGAWEIAKRNPIFGTGPETFGLTYWQVRHKEANQTSEWNFLYNKAHNEWLNLAANTGLFGLGTHLLLLGWFGVWIVRSSRASQSDGRSVAIPSGLPRRPAKGGTPRNDVLVAILAALLGVETVNFFGFSTVTTETYRYLFMSLTVVFTTEGKILKGDSFIKLLWWKYFLLTIIAIITFGVISGIFNRFQADLKYNLGRQYYSAGYIPEALEPLSQAVNLAPNEPVFRNELAESLAVAAISAWANNNETRAVEIKNEAVKNFKVVSAQSKYNLTFIRTQTQMEFLMKEIDPNLTDEALKLAQKAVDLSPTDPRGYYLLGRMYGELNDKSKAENLYRQALELKPDYAEAIKILNSEY